MKLRPATATSWDRRRFLRALLACVGSLSGAGLLAPAARDLAPLRAAFPTAAGSGLAAACARTLAPGRARARLTGRFDLALGPEACRRQVAAAARADFAARRTRDVAGWVLAETEVQVYAALA